MHIVYLMVFSWFSSDQFNFQNVFYFCRTSAVQSNPEETLVDGKRHITYQVREDIPFIPAC